jgi:hypothetical protein
LRCQPGDIVIYEAEDGEPGPHSAPPDML